MPQKRQASEETQEKVSFLLRFFIASRTASPSAPAYKCLVCNSFFLWVASNLLSTRSLALLYFHSDALCLGWRDKLSALSRMCCDLSTQRFDVLQCREEGRDSKERGEDTSSPLSLAGRGGSEGLLTGQQSLRKCLSTLLSANNSV